ncbi:MAG: hypothetical protein QXU92_02880 [Candidatus Diapherotrites archaeon]
MWLIQKIKEILFKKEKKEEQQLTQQKQENKELEIEEIHSIWDYLKITENTQAAHILTVVGFEEWIPMEEILRRIKELFGVDYKNKRSLYPHVKTLVDIGLLESISVGDKKKWRKREILIKLKTKKTEKEKEEVKAT